MEDRRETINKYRPFVRNGSTCACYVLCGGEGWEYQISLERASRGKNQPLRIKFSCRRHTNSELKGAFVF